MTETNEDHLRGAIVGEAMEWKATPYHYRPAGTAAAVAKLKGVGADCLTFIIGVYYNLGLVEDFEIPFYRPDFMMHSFARDVEGGEAQETYLEGVLTQGHEVERPKPGDVVLYRFRDGQIFAHGGIVIDWPTRIIHCFRGRFGVIEANGLHGQHVGVEHKFISHFPIKK